MLAATALSWAKPLPKTAKTRGQRPCEENSRQLYTSAAMFILEKIGHSLSYVNKQFDFLPDSTTTIIKEELTSPRAVTDIRRDLKESGSVRGAFETGYTPDKNKKKRYTLFYNIESI